MAALSPRCFCPSAPRRAKPYLFWDHRTKEYVDAQAGFGIIDDFAFFDAQTRGRGQMNLPLSFFRWNETLWQSFQAGYIKRLNTAVYFSLGSNLARRLYRYVDKWLYQGGQEIDLTKLATVKLGMGEGYRSPSHLANKLKPAIAELNDRGVAQISVAKSKGTDSGWKVVIRPAQSSQSRGRPREGITEQGTRENVSQGPNLPSGRPSVAAQCLVDLLIARDVSPDAAQRLVQEHRANVARQVEVFDFLVAKKDHRIQRPPAYLRRMIEQGWFLHRPPRGFVSREQQEEEERQRQEQARAALLAEREEAAGTVRCEVGEWASLPPEKRINFSILDLWITSFRAQHKRNPAAEEQAQRVARMVADLRTPAQQLDCRLSALRLDFQQKAHKQGIGPLDFPD